MLKLRTCVLNWRHRLTWNWLLWATTEPSSTHQPQGIQTNQQFMKKLEFVMDICVKGSITKKTFFSGIISGIPDFTYIYIWFDKNSQKEKSFLFMYHPFHKTLPRSNAFVNWFSVRFYGTDQPVSYNLTEFPVYRSTESR